MVNDIVQNQEVISKLLENDRAIPTKQEFHAKNDKGISNEANEAKPTAVTIQKPKAKKREYILYSVFEN